MSNLISQSFEGSWVYLCPRQLTELLVYIKGTYKVTKDIIVTENGKIIISVFVSILITKFMTYILMSCEIGSSDKNETGKTYEQVRDDKYRVKYIKEHIKALKQARE